MKTILRRLALCLALGWVLGGCSSYDPPKFDKLVFTCTNSRTTPQNRRSYTITVSPRQSIVIIEASGRNVANKTYKLPSPIFDSITNLVQQIQAPGNYAKQPKGDIHHTLSLLNGEQVVYDLKWSNTQQLKLPTLSLVKAVKTLVPDLDKLLQTSQDGSLG